MKYLSYLQGQFVSVERWCDKYLYQALADASTQVQWIALGGPRHGGSRTSRINKCTYSTVPIATAHTVQYWKCHTIQEWPSIEAHTGVGTNMASGGIATTAGLNGSLGGHNGSNALSG